MSALLKALEKEGLIRPPKWLSDNTHYLTLTGSITYGCSTNMSDIDVIGVCMPKKSFVFPHTDGLIHGFDEIPGFEQWQQHHILRPSSGKEYDFTVYSIIKYFKLLMDNNPNIIDSLYTRENHVLHCTQAFERVRGNKKVFLHKGLYHKFKGYAYSQLHKMHTKKPGIGSKRYESVQKYGYDPKFAYHIIRLLVECESLLIHGDMDLMGDNDRLRSIRRGEWTLDDIHNFFDTKKVHLEKLYQECDILPHRPNVAAIKSLLISVLEEHYGSLDNVLDTDKNTSDDIIDQIRLLIN